MGSADVVENIDTSLIVVSGFSALLALCGVVYACPWSHCSRKESSVTDYNCIWGVRVCLQLTAFFWLLSPILQVHETWTPRVDLLGALNVRGSVPCQVFLAARLGLFEPFFLFLGLLTLQHTLRQGQGWEVMFASDLSSSSTPLKRINLGIIGKAMRNTLPIFILQTVISMLTLIFSEDVDKNSGLPAWFIVSHEVELSGCQHLGSDGTLPSSGCIVCIYPFVSTVLTAVFVIYYLYHLWDTTSNMIRITVNQSLTRRMVTFRLFATLVLSMGVVCRGLTAITAPRSVPFELLRLGDFLSVLYFVIAASYSLVLKPVYDSRSAEKMNSSDAKFWREVDLMDTLKTERRV